MEILVEQTSSEDPHTFTVTVAGDGSTTAHDVTLSHDDFERLSRDGESPDAFLTRCFEFLLAREPKESILSRFDVSVISRYFSDFESHVSS